MIVHVLTPKFELKVMWGIVDWWTKELKFKNIEHFPHFDLTILTLSLMETESLCPDGS